MTVCVAATAESGKSVIIAADRMLSTPMIEFEHKSSKKIKQLSPRCHALTAGDALAHTELFSLVENQIGHLREPSVEQIVETIKQSYQEIRRKQIIQRILEPRAFSGFEDFYRHQHALNENLVFSIQSQIDNYNYGLEILVGGLSHTRAHIYSISDPGVSQCFDSINFHAIGSGSIHAFNSLIVRGCHQMLPLPEVLMIVFDAKRVAEIAPGVGASTDISIILPGGTVGIPPDRISDLLPINDHWRQGAESWGDECNTFLQSLATKPHPPQPEENPDPEGNSGTGDGTGDGEDDVDAGENGDHN